MHEEPFLVDLQNERAEAKTKKQKIFNLVFDEVRQNKLPKTSS